MSEQPPPYAPPPPGGFNTAFSSPPGTFPGAPYQLYPSQGLSGGGDPSFYQGPPGPSGSYVNQPGYQSYHSGPRAWDGPKPYGDPNKQTVYLVEQNQHGAGGRGGGALNSCLSACSAALCCCCLWDLLTHNLR